MAAGLHAPLATSRATPAWDRRTHTRVAINGVQGSTRRVFVADLSALLPAAT